MKRFYVSVPVEYVMGYLRTGHWEGYLEAENENEILDMLNGPDGMEGLDFYVDDYRVEDIGDPMMDLVEIEEME